MAGAGTNQGAARGAAARPNRYGKWRAATLMLVYVLMAVHIVHWRVAGRTLAPLELHEVMYTAELGIVTAGFLFMAAAILATAIFGRFFCSWGCHILALEDLAAWLLRKLHIKPRPVRSRILAFVPLVAMLYMFAWPQITRGLVLIWPDLAAWFGPAPPFDLRIAGDAEGWASFVTSDLWRNLPGPWTTALTFLVCGFAIVYFLGSRSFCNYGCPYGVVFALADRVAPGRIRLTGHCGQCGICTAGCQSGIRVHEEIARFGQVVSARCLKDLDCVSVCPDEALSYGPARPAGFKSLFHPDRPRPRYDFTPAEEAMMGGVFLLTLVVFRGLYSAVPFLMTLGLGGVMAFVAVMAHRLSTRPIVRWRETSLRQDGRLTRAGRVFAGGAALLAVFTLHSAFIRYHEAHGNSALLRAENMASPASRPLEEKALHHLRAVDRWGLVHPASLEPKLASLFLALGDLDSASRSLRRISETSRNNDVRAGAHTRLADLMVRSGDAGGAMSEYRSALKADPDHAGAHLELADLLVAEEQLPEAEKHLRRALELRPQSVRALFNLGIVLGRTGQEPEALELLRRAQRLEPREPSIRRAMELLAEAGAAPPTR